MNNMAIQFQNKILRVWLRTDWNIILLDTLPTKDI